MRWISNNATVYAAIGASRNERVIIAGHWNRYLNHPAAAVWRNAYNRSVSSASGRNHKLLTRAALTEVQAINRIEVFIYERTCATQFDRRRCRYIRPPSTTVDFDPYLVTFMNITDDDFRPKLVYVLTDIRSSWATYTIV